MLKEINSLEKEIDEIEAFVGNRTLLVDEQDNQLESDTIYERILEAKTTLGKLFKNKKVLEELFRFSTHIG